MTRNQQTDKRKPGTPGTLSRWVLRKTNARMNRKIELPGRDAMPVTPHRLDGADREQAWQRIAAASPASRSTKASPTGNAR